MGHDYYTDDKETTEDFGFWKFNSSQYDRSKRIINQNTYMNCRYQQPIVS